MITTGLFGLSLAIFLLGFAIGRRTARRPNIPADLVLALSGEDHATSVRRSLLRATYDASPRAVAAATAAAWAALREVVSSPDGRGYLGGAR